MFFDAATAATIVAVDSLSGETFLILESCELCCKFEVVAFVAIRCNLMLDCGLFLPSLILVAESPEPIRNIDNEPSTIPIRKITRA